MTRVRDIALIAIFAPIIVAIVVLTMIATLVFLGRPVFFTQARAGKNGKEFKLIKFRTMLIGDGPDEARMTKFGSFLRKTSLDELPELWNVLKGEMSLVGPRPLPVRYLPRYSKEQFRRHEVLPGITGLAQINGRNSLSWEDKFKYDVLYVDSKSQFLDFKIIFLTVFQLIRPRGISHEGEATMSEFGV
ncbi:MAG: sugar transferase [Kiritimatiellae bacterium]|nr:sugar transferase [Kiritimatiellia bacterium]